VVDAKSGMDRGGAGRQGEHAVREVSEGFTPTGSAIIATWPSSIRIFSCRRTRGDRLFTPHLVPMNRGILSTIYVAASPKVAAEPA